MFFISCIKRKNNTELNIKRPLYVYFVMCIDAVPQIYNDVSDLLATCQIAAFIEPVNAALKLVHTGVFAPLMQV